MCPASVGGECTKWAFLFTRLLGKETIHAQECCRKGEACCRTATGSDLFPYLTCLHATFILLSIFSLVETISLQIWERPLSWHAKCSLPVSVACLSSLLSVGRPAIACAKCKSQSRDLARMFLRVIYLVADQSKSLWSSGQIWLAISIWSDLYSNFRQLPRNDEFPVISRGQCLSIYTYLISYKFHIVGTKPSLIYSGFANTLGTSGRACSSGSLKTSKI